MRHSIDVLFLNAEGEVEGSYENLPPWRATRILRRAQGVLELPAGTVARSHTKRGDRIRFHPSSG